MSDAMPRGAPVLILESSGLEPSAGIWQDGRWLAYASSSKPALESLFHVIEDCLKQADVKLEGIAAFLYDEGPGSILGIRVASMAIRTWQAFSLRPVFAYRSLDFLAKTIAVEKGEDCLLLSDYRKSSWLGRRLHDPAIAIYDSQALGASGLPLYYVRSRRAFSGPPVEATELSLDLKNNPEAFSGKSFVRRVEVPEIFSIEDVAYRRWETPA